MLYARAYLEGCKNDNYENGKIVNYEKIHGKDLCMRIRI